MWFFSVWQHSWLGDQFNQSMKKVFLPSGLQQLTVGHGLEHCGDLCDRDLASKVEIPLILGRFVCCISRVFSSVGHYSCEFSGVFPSLFKEIMRVATLAALQMPGVGVMFGSSILLLPRLVLLYLSPCSMLVAGSL